MSPTSTRWLPMVALCALMALLYIVFGTDVLVTSPGVLIANMAGAPFDIKQMVESIKTGVEDMRSKTDAKMEALQREIERVELKGNSAGVFAPRAAGRAPAVELLHSGDGAAAVPIFRRSSEFAPFYSASAEGSDLTLADFVRAVANLKTSEAAKKSLSVGTGSAGGYAVPNVLMPGILDALAPVSSLMQAGAGIVDVSAFDGKKFDMAGINAIPTAAWRDENGSVTESDPTFRLIESQPRSLAFYFKVSRELLADAANVDVALRQVIAQAFAAKLDITGLRGSGTAPEPRGIRNTAGVHVVGSGASGAIGPTWPQVLALYGDIMGVDAPMPGAAIMHPRSWLRLQAQVDSTGQPLQAPPALRDLRLLHSSQIPINIAAGSNSDTSELYLGDFSQVLWVFKERPTIQLANELFALSGQVAFVCHVRADLMVLRPGALVVLTGLR